MERSKAERLAYDDILKVWQQSFGANREDFVTKEPLLKRISKVFLQYNHSYTKNGPTARAKNITLSVKRGLQTVAYFERVFSPLIAPPPRTTKNYIPFKRWEQKLSRKGLHFEVDLSFAVIRVPSYDEFLFGNESVSSWNSDNTKAPPSPVSAKDDNDEPDDDCKTNTCSLTSDTLTRKCSKCGKYANIHPSDQSTQTIMHWPQFSHSWPANFFEIQDSIGDTMDN